MRLLDRARTYLGLDPAPLLNGFASSSRGPKLPVCEKCGALVGYESQQAHTAWHGTSGSEDGAS